MLKKIKDISIFLVIFLIAIVNGSDKCGYLSVSVKAGMQIYIDTTFAGRDSLSDFELPVGIHIIHVYNAQNLDLSERGISKTIDISENEHLQLDFTQIEEVKILSFPIGGSVLSGNTLIGHTPISFNRKLVGSHPIKIEKQGYNDTFFNLVRDKNEYHFNLEPLKDDNQLKVTTSLENQNELKWYREGLIVASLVSSWTAFYFKRQADEAYSKYQVVSDPGRRIDLWNQTGRYDTFSELAIGVSIATMGTYFLFLLFD